MPTADELAAQFEQFLAEQQRGDEQPSARLAGRQTITRSRGALFIRWSRLGADHDVLDARAVRARVDARLDGEGHARLERMRVALDDVGILVGLQADAVAGAVDEPVAVRRRRR